MTITAEAFWGEYCRHTGIVAPLPDVDWFGDSPEMADELLALVLDGTKKATCALLRWHESRGIMPKLGDYCIITDGANVPRCIIQTTQIDIMPVREVDAKFAWDEGEGDRSLAYWKREHDAFYTREAKDLGLTYDDSLLAVCERFQCVWPK